MSQGKLRIMQVDGLYQVYTNYFYRNHPSLSLQSSSTQAKALFDDGFSAIHAIVPYIRDCETEYFISDNRYLQRAWAKEHNIKFSMLSPSWEADMVRLRIAEFKPDVLYIADPIKYNGNFLKTLPHKPKLTIAWRAADVPFGINWTGYDIILTTLPLMIPFAEKLGAKKGILFRPGMPKWIADSVADVPQTVDVCFTGSIYPGQHAERYAIVETLAQAARQDGFSLDLHLACDQALLTLAMKQFVRPAVFGSEMYKALKKAKIVVNTIGSVHLKNSDGSNQYDLSEGHTINMRLFEATGCGVMILTKEHDSLTDYFEAGKEVATYRDQLDLIQKIRYYLQHDAERQEIALAGQKRCLTDWNMDNAANNFMKIVREHI